MLEPFHKPQDVFQIHNFFVNSSENDIEEIVPLLNQTYYFNGQVYDILELALITANPVVINIVLDNFPLIPYSTRYYRFSRMRRRLPLQLSQVITDHINRFYNDDVDADEEGLMINACSIS
jgi:hypothetical protein